MSRFRSRGRPARTLAEVLVTLSIVALLLALLLPAVQKVRETSQQMTCHNHLRQLVIGVHNHHDIRRTMPPYSTGLAGTPYANWFCYLAPYLEQDNLPKPAISGGVVIVTNNPMPGNRKFEVLYCPTDPTASMSAYRGKTSYEANWYAFSSGQGGWFPQAQPFANLTTGLSQVVLFAETYSECNGITRFALETPWYHTFGITQDALPSDDPSYLPNDYTMFQTQPAVDACDLLRTQTSHTTMPVALADGSVRPVSPDIDPNIWKKALQPRGEAPPAGWSGW
jgi:hypothetical protein